MKLSFVILLAALTASQVVFAKKEGPTTATSTAGGLRGGDAAVNPSANEEEGDQQQQQKQQQQQQQQRRELSPTEDCGEILQWKVYTPGTPTRWPVPKNNTDEPGYMFRLRNGTCYPTRRFVNYNIMMYTTPWIVGKPTCGINFPACGFIKLYSEDLQKPVLRSGKDFTWPWFLTQDTPCFAGTPDAGKINGTGMCNPSAEIHDAKKANANLAPGTYTLYGDTYSNCINDTLPTRGDLDSSRLTFVVKEDC